MSQIVFDKRIVVAEIRNPLKDFQLTREEIEIRTDPLLGHTTRIVSPKGLDVVPEEDPLPDFVRQSPPCFFCEGRVDSQTPLLPESIHGPGRLQMGEAILFPNLSGYGQYSGVCILSKYHFTTLEEFNGEQLFNAMKACQVYFQLCAKEERIPLYPTVNWNYLLSAGSSLLHPHIQPVLDSIPTTFHQRLLKDNSAYIEKNGISFWKELLVSERGGPRYLYETENVAWFTPFAPQGFNEINAIVGRGESFVDLSQDVIQELANGLITVFQFYHEIRHNSFNLSLFSCPMHQDDPNLSMPCLLKIATRPVFMPHYRNDTTFFEKFHQESVVDHTPEDIAADFRQILPKGMG